MRRHFANHFPCSFPFLFEIQLKEKVEALERRLAAEQSKAEDLQFSIDEATFCGDELTVSETNR